MHLRIGLLIDPAGKSVREVNAKSWDATETLDALSNPVDGAICYWDLPGSDDYLVLGDFLNAMPAGKAFRREGFRLFAKDYYGPALILGREPEEAMRPRLTCAEVLAAITFFEAVSSGA